MREAGLWLCLLTAGCATVPPSVKTLDPSHQQAVHVQAKQKFHARLSLWERTAQGWHRVYAAPAVIGRNGLAPAGAKKEGDGRAPSGVYALRRAFGYNAEFVTGLDYTAATAEDIWVDDPSSPLYNQWTKGTAASFEKLRRDDNLYKFAAVIEYNTSPIVPGAGSAIFMHIWRRYDRPTAGCVALSERNLRRVLKRLDRNQLPVIILEK